MIEKLIEYSIRNRFIVLIVAAGLAIWGIYAVLNTPVDAIPDLSENQVIVFTDWMGRSPREIEDQVTYPLSLKLQGLAGVKTIRSSSEFNFSMITIIFEDGVNFYFARQRVLEKLDEVRGSPLLPQGVVPRLAADATALGQIFWYTVEPDPKHPVDPARLWALNRYYIVPQLNSASGVSEVATVGGAPVEYQIDVHPEALRAYGITLGDVYTAVAKSNWAAGGGVIQKNNAEYLVRFVGWIKGKESIERTAIRRVPGGTPVYVDNVATVQLGQQFRRSVYEKDGNEVAGGVVLMRYGENPLAVTQRIKEKIQEMQPGLPAGVRIVPAYDRTRLIEGAIHTLTSVMWHEMVIATIAVFLILLHLRSAFVICVTLPLAVLFSFLLMWLLRRFGIIDIQANIMSLAGITISIGILVDQAIVMTENATHHLKEQFGERKVTGDIRALIIPACRTVGRPIFFSVLIMLISFIPVFALSGREGKLFHPLAFTKSFALAGVALISVTVVPALIPTFLKGRLKSEEDNWIVRSFVAIYKPVLTWFLPRRNFVTWAFAALLVLAAGMFPLQALVGRGTSDAGWRLAFFFVLILVLTVVGVLFLLDFIRQVREWPAVRDPARNQAVEALFADLSWKALAIATLLLLGWFAYHFSKIGVTFMPALDEGSTLDMPITVPRTSITQAADDLKARDALLRGFPEVESVVGKSGRADTPTDPAPLDMVETFVNFRPKELWPKRVLRYDDAVRQTRAVLRALEEHDFVVRAPHEDDRDDVVKAATQKALERFDEIMRELARARYQAVESDLGPLLTRSAVDETVRRIRQTGTLREQAPVEEKQLGALAGMLAPEFGAWLAKNPALEDVTRLTSSVANRLKDIGAIDDPVTALTIKESLPRQALRQTADFLGMERKTFAGEVLDAVKARRTALWREGVKKVDWELFDQAVQGYTWLALEELVKAGNDVALLGGARRGAESVRFADEAVKAELHKEHDRRAFEPFFPLTDNLHKPFADRVFLWQRESGPKGDLVDDEFGRVLQVPGWTNIFTQPIINRIEMLSTGVRTDIGVKVFGPNLPAIDRVGKEIELALKPIDGARDVVAAPVMGKGYLEIDVDLERAARYGVSVEDIKNTVEVALGGQAVTQTVEGRERFPVRIRYPRAQREDEETVRRMLVSGAGMPAAGGMDNPSGGGSAPVSAMEGGSPVVSEASKGAKHQAAPPHGSTGRQPLQVPLGAVADVRIAEGPAMMRSENGQLMNYVTLNVRGRDLVGFVDEAQRVVADKVKLPEGVHIEWSGEFEHQVRAAKTLCFVFPAAIVLIFVVLYLTYKDLWDAMLMMLAVPEALAGGAFLQFLFPKILHGWDTPPLDFSVAVWVGYIACFGMATETGIIMLVYLREAVAKRGGLENIKSLDELRQAVIEGAVHRLRPKLLTEGVAIIALAPMLYMSGVGAEIITPMAVPVLGGLLISDEVVDIFLPVRFYWVRRARWLKLHSKAARAESL
jgi:Cu(I)/Ag(I) efflux system membrane protein CusA/SilA